MLAKRAGMWPLRLLLLSATSLSWGTSPGHNVNGKSASINAPGGGRRHRTPRLGNGAGKVIAGERDCTHPQELGAKGRQRTGEMVQGELQGGERAETGPRSGQLAGEVVGPQLHIVERQAVCVVARNPVPVANWTCGTATFSGCRSGEGTGEKERTVGEPLRPGSIGSVEPPRSAGCVVQVLQQRPRFRICRRATDVSS
jgi:hypothetical protein